MPIDLKELYWAAGFMEGEGSFGSRKHRNLRNIHSRCSAYQKQREPLERLQKIFGGKIYTDGTRGFSWNANGTLARGVALTLYSLMGSRRKEQIRTMLKNDNSTYKGSPEFKKRVTNRYASKQC